MRPMGPLELDHPSVGELCPGCRTVIKPGDYVALVPIGSGDDEDSRRACREGRVYNAVAVVAHYSCATGQESPP